MPRLSRKNLLITLLTLACLVALTLAYRWFETRYLRTFDERAAVFSGAELQLYSVNAITKGTDSQGEVTVRLKKDGRIVNGQGADTDIIVASVKAYISALNRLFGHVAKMNPQL